ncbi:MAG: alanine dehydrogenase [Candidatus Melainabacteria bacterium GWF2_37_15]|nr:MAG: alanine dehydrogenase [Candidatus Melainabacteria bacterium GWF2_37_15]
MIIGVPKEIKAQEERVALTPAGAEMLAKAGHTVYIQDKAGLGSGFSNEDYEEHGAVILNSAKEVYDKAEMILKVKEPLTQEYDLMREGLVLFTYLHLAAVPQLAKVLCEKKVVGIAYETVQNSDKSLPLLTPMSEVAGRMSVQIASRLLEKYYGGSGVLMGGVPGVSPAKVVIIGAGIAGSNAAKIALGLRADVTVLDVNLDKLRYLNDLYGERLITIYSNPYNIRNQVQKADVVIGAVLVPGAKAPHLVTEDMVKSMKPGSVIIDIAIDQGGSVETIDRVTTHENPTYIKHGVLHYAVANMPGAVPRTSTIALTNATMPFVLELANKGYEKAARDNPAVLKGFNTLNGDIVHEEVKKALSPRA